MKLETTQITKAIQYCSRTLKRYLVYMRTKKEVTTTSAASTSTPTSANMACNDAATLLLISGPSDTHGSLTLINKTNNDNNKKKNRPQEPISIIRNGNEKAEAPASFDYCEMILGELVGTGAFCEVRDLHDVRLIRRRNKTCSKPYQVKEKKEKKKQILSNTNTNNKNVILVNTSIRPAKILNWGTLVMLLSIYDRIYYQNVTIKYSIMHLQTV